MWTSCSRSTPRTAGPAALFPLRSLHHAELAGGRAADRPSIRSRRLWVGAVAVEGSDAAPHSTRRPVAMRFVVQRLVEALVVLLVMSFVIYGLIGLMPGDPDRPDGRRRSEPDAGGRGAAEGALRPRPAALDRYLHWLGRRAAGRLRLFAAACRAGAGGAAAAPRQHAAADGRLSLALRARHRASRSASSPRAKPRFVADYGRQPARASPASRCRRSGWRCC